MSGASKAIYELVTGIFSTKADDIIDPGPVSLVSQLDEIKGKTFKDIETKNQVEANIIKNRSKLDKQTKEAFEPNPMFMEVDETPKQAAFENIKERDAFESRERNYETEFEGKIINSDLIGQNIDESLPGKDRLDLIRSDLSNRMEGFTNFNDAYGSSITDPLAGSGPMGEIVSGVSIPVRSNELISFYSTADNTVDEIFKRTAKNRPGERGIKGSDLLKRFADSKVKQSELKFINFNSRIKEKEFYTETDLKDIIEKSGIRVIANIKRKGINPDYYSMEELSYPDMQRQIDFPFGDTRTQLRDTGEPVVELEYFEITLDAFPNFNKKASDPLDDYDAKLRYIESNVGNTGDTLHFNHNTLGHMRGSILELENGEKILLVEELQTDALKSLKGSTRAREYNRKVTVDDEGDRVFQRDTYAFSKDEPRSRQNLIHKRPTIFKDFAAKSKENKLLHPNIANYNSFFPRFAKDVINPRTGTVLAKKGKNVSYKRQKKLANNGILQFDVEFFNPNPPAGRANKWYVETIGSSDVLKEAKPVLSDPRSSNLLRDDMITEGEADDMAIAFTKRLMDDEDYFGTIVKYPQNVDRKVPISGDSDYIEKLIQAAIVHAKQNDIDKIVIPNVDMMAEARSIKQSDREYKLMTKIYKDAVDKVVEKLEREFKGKIKTGTYKLGVNDTNYVKASEQEGLGTPKRNKMLSKFLDISKLDLNLEQIMARFSKGGLVTAPSNGLMSR